MFILTTGVDLSTSTNIMDSYCELFRQNNHSYTLYPSRALLHIFYILLLLFSYGCYVYLFSFSFTPLDCSFVSFVFTSFVSFSFVSPPTLPTVPIPFFSFSSSSSFVF